MVEDCIPYALIGALAGMIYLISPTFFSNKKKKVLTEYIKIFKFPKL